MTNAAPLCPGCFVDKGTQNPCAYCGYDEAAPRSPLVLPHRTLLNGQFLIGRVLGKPGGFGITYLAWDQQLHTRVAIKEYLPRELAGRGVGQSTVAAHSGEDAELFRFGLEQFLQEARTLAQLDHPNVVRVRHFFEANGTAYLVMDYYEGLSFAEYLEQQGGRVPEETAVQLMLPILDGLRAVHAKGFLHRDVKPQNIYLAKTDAGGVRPILLDFGAARQAMGERSRSMSVVISAGYAPFEQYSRKGKQGPWTDIYAAAAVLYQAVTGVVPPEATDRIMDDELKPATGFGISQRLSDALSAALAVAPEARAQNVQAFQMALRHPGSGSTRPVEMPDTSASTPAQTAHAQEHPPKDNIPKKSKGGCLLPSVLLVSLILVALFAFFLTPQEQEQKRAIPSGGPNGDRNPNATVTLEDDLDISPLTLIAGRYRDMGDGTVMDIETGLQWMRCALGQNWSQSTCLGEAKGFDWDAALAAADSLNRSGGYAGSRDWRVPTIGELQGLRYCKDQTGGPGVWLNDESTCEGDVARPTIETRAFPETPNWWFWSSSPYAGTSYGAWYVNFGYGYVGNDDKSLQGYVRLVRGGQ
ncbi:DUF1566 domain-containing protein [Thiohalocapsa marina]|uniref:non-specific serine/threonine protein kinase n=1 Tax=Thiohalocapsa marina TaxID=424902 RepID=A0A5M8FDL2_9GAMM|nr:DUF1566 domain-containing protein [Thiohalocapsa marina]KAA6182484.1 DUF1566 domain-containing protein [Thiohalocapsa marina]